MTDPTKAVFLSYASQDAEAAKRICEALRAAGVEVWFDQAELVGGDAWDNKIRGQISSCALFVPVISAATQARREGYFRIEWKLAAQRTHAMADGTPFLLPVLIDDTRDAEALVPSEFRALQWTRLPGGENGEKFCARVMKLLGGPEPVGAALRRDPAEPSRHKAAPTTRPSWLVPVILGVVAVVAVGLWQPWKSSVGPAAGKPAETTRVAGPLTEAQKLVEKARVILDEGDEINRENYALAEELLKKAERLDPTEATAWALHAQLSASLHWFAFDISQARREAMRVQASRALTLAPESDDAQLAVVRVQIELDQNQAESLRTLEALVKRSPENWQAWRQLARCLRKNGDADGALAALRQALKLSANHLAVANDLFNHLTNIGDFAEAERVIRELPAGRKSARLLAHDLFVELYWRGNSASAAAMVTNWPSWFLAEDRGAGHAALAALWNRDPAQAQKILASYPRDYLTDYLFTGPRAILTAWANEQAGNEEAAQADWKIARQVTERILAEFPDDREALYWKAWALARLGDRPGATAILRLLEQREARSNGLFIFGGLAGLKTALGDIEGAVDLLANVRVDLPRNIKPVTKAFLILNPVFDPLRGNARFQALVAAAPGPEEKKPSSPVSGSISAPSEKSVAVLAFANLSDDKGNEYFSDGISEELLNVLAKVPGLKVTARTSAFYFKGKEVPIPEIAKQLGVAYVVEGSVRKQGDKVRITAQLIKAADGFHVWSDTFTRDLKDIFAVQDEIAGLIAQNLKLTLETKTRVNERIDPEAFRLVLEGRHFLAQRSDAGFDQAERSFAAALKIEPRYAEAQIGLANVTMLRGRYRYVAGRGDGGTYGRLALAQSQLALEMDPTMAGPHATMGSVLTDEGQLPEAMAAFDRALHIEGNFATAYHWRSHVFAIGGRLDLALVDIRRAAVLDPLSFITLYIEGFFLSDAQRYAEALTVFNRAAAIRREPFLPLEGGRARALLAIGQKEQAMEVARRVLDHPDVVTHAWHGASDALDVLYQSGAVDEAKERAADLLRRIPQGSYIRGFVKCAIGDFAGGLPELATVPAIIRNLIYFYPMLDPVRNTPEFRQLLVQLNCVEEYKVGRETLQRMQQGMEGNK